MKRILNSLLFKVFCGIVIGIIIGIFNIEWLNRLLLTFKGLFGNFLGFTIPLIMMGLIMPAISDLGKNSGKLLLITVAIAYAFTLFSGFSTYFVSDALFPSLLQFLFRYAPYHERDDRFGILIYRRDRALIP